MLASLRSPVAARYPMKPPANASPAPVGSNTLSSGNAGAKKLDFSANMNAPCSPFFMMTCLGIVESHQVNVLEKREDVGARAMYPEVQGVAGGQFRLLHLLQDVEL